jgi:hypothetical protein
VEFRDGDWCFFVVMAGLVPAIHVFTGCTKDVDGRHKGGHDDVKWPTSHAASMSRNSTGQPWHEAGHDVEKCRRIRSTDA